MFEGLESAGYFQESLGYDCVDSGFVPGTVGNDLKAELVLTLRKPHLWPIPQTISAWEEDDVFDMVEFIYDHTSKPTKCYYHDYSGCGLHCSEFDKKEGQRDYRQKINRILGAYDSGFELSETGEVLALAPTGFERLLEADVPDDEKGNIGARVEAATNKFRRHRASVEDRKDAVRDLAAVLEFLRPQIKLALFAKDENDIFNIANNFEVRHHNLDQKAGYDKTIWLTWMFYFYLATIHAVVRLVERDSA